jgi:hypothetical protein
VINKYHGVESIEVHISRRAHKRVWGELPTDEREGERRRMAAAVSRARGERWPLSNRIFWRKARKAAAHRARQGRWWRSGADPSPAMIRAAVSVAQEALLAAAAEREA